MSKETRPAWIQFWGSVVSAALTIATIIVIAWLGASKFADWENERAINRRIYDQRFIVSQEFHKNIMEIMNIGGRYYLSYFFKANTPIADISESDKAAMMKVDFEAFHEFEFIIQRLQHNSAMAKILFRNEDISKQIFAVSTKLSSLDYAACNTFDEFITQNKDILGKANHILTLMSEEIYCQDPEKKAP